jgi:IS605 OrfB family transposase
LFNRKFERGKFIALSGRRQKVNFKYRLGRVDKEVNLLQRKRGIYLRKASGTKLYYHIDKRYKYVEAKRNKLHLELAHQLANKFVQIALYHHVNAIHFENLKWARQAKKWQQGHFINRNQVHFVYSLIQTKTKELAERLGIPVRLVDARYTSQICSECHRLKRPNFDDKVKAVRLAENNKIFQCSHEYHKGNSHGIIRSRNAAKGKPLFICDADLNAARNIALSTPIA